jgi:glycosyltransferase involved in cell wall biosynthesis
VSVLESMACGLPIVASDLPANRQWINAQGGEVVPVRDPDAVCQALMRLHDQPGLAEQMGAHNRARIERQASRRGQMDAMWRHYQKLLNCNGLRMQRKRAVSG